MGFRYIHSECLDEEIIDIEGIPTILIRPKDTEGKLPTILFYHGWSSTKEYQRLRAFTLAILGYQVLIPDAIYHGDRNPLDYYDLKSAKAYFWRTIISNLRESEKIIDYAVENLEADKNRIGLIGNSMGGITAAGIFVANEDIKTAVILNGSCDWDLSNRLFKERFQIEMTEELYEMEKYIEDYNPTNNLKKLQNRPLLLLHGDMDRVVRADAQEAFMKKAKLVYEDATHIKYISYPNLNHFVTTNMMEEACIWFHKFL